MKTVKMIMAAAIVALGAASLQVNAANVNSIDMHPGHNGDQTTVALADHVSPLTGINSQGVDTAPGRN